MAEGRAASVVSRLSQITREMSDRRALRDRNTETARDQSRQNLQAQGQVAEKVAKHLGELGRRQRAANGWATEKTLTEKQVVMGFGPEEDEQPDEFAKYTVSSTPLPPAHVEPAQPAPEERQEPQQRKYSPAVAPPPAPEPEPTPPPQPTRRPRHRRAESFDDDDFSNNSWMR